MKKQINSIGLLFLLLLTGCAAEEVKQNNRPDWIDKPEPNFVGICATPVKGTDTQEQCAYKKGLAHIAMSKGVPLDMSSTMTIDAMTIEKVATEKTGSGYGQLQATLKMDEKNIKLSGSVIDKWHDETTNIMYVLIREN